MGKATQHHMRHIIELLVHRADNRLMVIAVTGRPPGGDSVDQPAPIGQLDLRATGFHRGQRQSLRSASGYKVARDVLILGRGAHRHPLARRAGSCPWIMSLGPKV